MRIPQSTHGWDLHSSINIDVHVGDHHRSLVRTQASHVGFRHRSTTGRAWSHGVRLPNCRFTCAHAGVAHVAERIDLEHCGGGNNKQNEDQGLSLGHSLK